MNRFSSFVFSVVLLLCGLFSGAKAETHQAPAVQVDDLVDYLQAPLFNDLGDHHYAITTSVPAAQKFFDQGLILSYGFNHGEAARSFREAARLDTACAMAWWGAALVLGPNINAAMDPESVPEAWEAIEKARELAPNASASEQALISALEKRYAPEPLQDRTALDVGYADAMRDVAARFPDDMEIATLFGEALMDLIPWKYWNRDGTMNAQTPEILATFEKVLAREPNHPGANHLYIHATEASTNPDRAIPSADRLVNLVPGAGHLVHMPGHIYLRVGRYHDASEANERANLADESYEAQCHAQGIYPIAYHSHNYHFLAYTCGMEGRSGRAIEASRLLGERVPLEMMTMPGMLGMQHFWITPVYALARFGRWDEILALPQPESVLLYPNGVWRYARGLANLRKGDLGAAKKEMAELETIAADSSLIKVTIWDLNNTFDVMQVAKHVLRGEIAAASGHVDEAVRELEAGVVAEHHLNYDEPPPWYFPVRHALGAVLLKAGRAAEAEAVYRKDLLENRDNGWALFGLMQSLEAQKKMKDAGEVRKRFETAWKLADVKLAASMF